MAPFDVGNERYSFLHFFVKLRPSRDGMMPPHTDKEVPLYFNLPIQMLVLPGNTLQTHPEMMNTLLPSQADIKLAITGGYCQYQSM